MSKPIKIIERSSFDEKAKVREIPVKPKIKKVKLYEKIGRRGVEDLIRSKQSK